MGRPKLVSRDQILRRERLQGNAHFSCSTHLEQDWQLTRLIHYLLPGICDDHTYIHTYHSLYMRLPVRFVVEACWEHKIRNDKRETNERDKYYPQNFAAERQSCVQAKFVVKINLTFKKLSWFLF